VRLVPESIQSASLTNMLVFSALIQTGQKASTPKSLLAQEAVAGSSRLQGASEETTEPAKAPPETRNSKDSQPTHTEESSPPKDDRSDRRRQRERSSERRSRRHREDGDGASTRTEQSPHDRHHGTGSHNDTTQDASVEQRPSDISRPRKSDEQSGQEASARGDHSDDRSSRHSERNSEVDADSQREGSEPRRSRRKRDDHGDDKSYRSEHTSSRRSRRHRDASRESRSKDTSDSRKDAPKEDSRHGSKEMSPRRQRSRERRRDGEVKSKTESSSPAAHTQPQIIVNEPGDSLATLKARRPILAARGSVMSLPFLQTTSGTPPGHHGGLVIMNPDAPSILEEDEPEQVIKGSSAEYFDATASAETLVESENGRGSTTSLSSGFAPNRDETPERKNSKFSVTSILKTRRSNVSTIRARPSRAKDFTLSEPASDVDSDAEMMVVLLDEKSGKNPWKQCAPSLLLFCFRCI
jgi:hypothetical protein